MGKVACIHGHLFPRMTDAEIKMLALRPATWAQEPTCVRCGTGATVLSPTMQRALILRAYVANMPA